MIDTPTAISLFGVSVSFCSATVTIIFIFYNRKRKRRELIDAVYYHAQVAIETLEKQKGANKTIREKIKKDKSYAPYAAVSSANDITYDQVIGVMEWLKKQNKDEEKEAILYYFHMQAALHATAMSFHLEFVREFSSERKKELWMAWEEYQRETLEYAYKTKSILSGIRGAG